MTNGETKNDKFKRLASKRVTNAIKKIELIGHLAASSYESTQEEQDKIFVAIQEALDGIKTKFSKSKKADAGKFEL